MQDPWSFAGIHPLANGKHREISTAKDTGNLFVIDSQVLELAKPLMSR